MQHVERSLAAPPVGGSYNFMDYGNSSQGLAGEAGQGDEWTLGADCDTMQVMAAMSCSHQIVVP